MRNLGAPEWFDHRYRFKPADWGPAAVLRPALAVTGACMYIKREVIDAIGLLRRGVSDGATRTSTTACVPGRPATGCMYCPAAELDHRRVASPAGPRSANESEPRSRCSGAGGASSSTPASVRNCDRGLRIVYVTEDTGVGGGHRDVFEHLNGLRERGHEAELWSLGETPDWFPLQAPVRTFADYDELVRALAPIQAIKVATWWNTAAPVWQASVRDGHSRLLRPGHRDQLLPRRRTALRNGVLASYRPEFRYMTISSWNRDRLRELGLDAALIPPGIDLEQLHARCRTSSGATTWCWHSDDRTR